MLALLAAEALIGQRPDWREGELSRRHAKLVNGAACASVARRLGLQKALRLAGSATKQGARENDRILGDAMEALMAAVYDDGGLEAARRVFDHAWSEALEEALAAEEKESKTALQEWAMARGLPLPAYTELSRAGPPHAPVFVVEVRLVGYDPERGGGGSLRSAEKAAARAFLDKWAPSA